MDQFCGRALPYIKADFAGETGPAVSLGHDDSQCYEISATACWLRTSSMQVNHSSTFKIAI